MPNPYDPLPEPAIGNNPDEIHLVVGRALTQWERLEYRISEIYCLLLQAQPISSPAARAFGVVASSSSRLNMVKEAVKVFPCLAEYADLRSRINEFIQLVGNFGARRNEIAHGHVVTIAGDPNNTMLLPAFYHTKKYDSENTYRAKYKYAVNEITHYQIWFAKLISEADELKLEIERMLLAFPRLPNLPHN